MSQVGIELFSCGAAILDGFPSVSSQQIRSYQVSNKCARSDGLRTVIYSTLWRRELIFVR